MDSIPHQLFAKASEQGLVCLLSEQGDHCIKPSFDSCKWYLTYQKGAWILIVKDVPQMRLSYEEAMTFIDRLEPPKVLSFRVKTSRGRLK
jgi:hypothetical protein